MKTEMTYNLEPRKYMHVSGVWWGCCYFLSDIDECLQNNRCTEDTGSTCQNSQGSYTCLCPAGEQMTDNKCVANHKSSSWVMPAVGRLPPAASCLVYFQQEYNKSDMLQNRPSMPDTQLICGFLFFFIKQKHWSISIWWSNHAGASVVAVLIVSATCACLIQQRRKLQHIKHRNFQQHGGTLLFEEIKSQQGISFKIFSEAELQEATDKFNQKRVLGHGGHGTVYMGLLKGNVQVAVKRCMSIDEQHKKEFGKEMLILSQINHRNIVKLLGCCLEVEVPMLVYEFIPNGTLFQLIHGNLGRQISLATRMQIAHQSAEALAYLHSWASPPILHGDVKSANILINLDYTVKVSDFGASILAPTDESQFVTIVQGTCG